MSELVRVDTPRFVHTTQDEKEWGIAASRTRRYVEFEKAGTVLQQNFFWGVEELVNLLKEEGLSDQLKFQVIGKDRNRIHFHHCGLELRSVAQKCQGLYPYFYNYNQQAFIFYPQPPSDSERHLASEVGLSESHTAKRKSINACIEQANRYRRSISLPSPVKFTFNPRAADEANLKAVYQKFQGLCIGECHDHEYPKKFILQNMEKLAELGVKTLFTEYFLYDTQQHLLDQYFDDPNPDAEIPLVLQAWAEMFGPTLHMLEMLREAKRNRIRVVGIDTSTTRTISLMDSTGRSHTRASIGRRRVQAMNFIAQQIIGHEKGDSKYLAHMGLSHAATETVYDKRVPFSCLKGLLSRPQITTPGLADLLQCPLFYITDHGICIEKVSVNTDVHVYSDAVHKNVHVRLDRPKDDKPWTTLQKCKTVAKALAVLAVLGAIAAARLLKRGE